MSVAQAMRDIDSREFAEWQAFYQIEPFGEERADYRQAITSQQVSNIADGLSGKKQGRSLDEFFPKFDQSEQTKNEEMLAKKAAFEVTHRGMFKKHGNDSNTSGSTGGENGPISEGSKEGPGAND